MARTFSRFCGDQSGATGVEYGIIALLISIAVIGGVRSVSSAVAAMYNTISTAVPGV